MKINQITPIRYGQSEINKPETDFLPEEEIVTLQNKARAALQRYCSVQEF